MRRKEIWCSHPIDLFILVQNIRTGLKVLMFIFTKSIAICKKSFLINQNQGLHRRRVSLIPFYLWRIRCWSYHIHRIIKTWTCCYVYIGCDIIDHVSCKVLRFIYHSVRITLLWWYDVNVEPICVYLTMIMAGKHISNNKANTALREKKLLLYFPMLSITRYTSSFSFKSLLCKSLKHQRCGSIYLKGLC